MLMAVVLTKPFDFSRMSSKNNLRIRKPQLMKSALVFKSVSQKVHKIIERTSCSLISQIELIWHNRNLRVTSRLASDESTLCT